MKTVAIIPAAGHSRRMGEPKLLLPWNGQAVIQHVLQAWKATAVDRILVVVRQSDHQLAAICQQERVEVLQPAIDPPDMKASVQVALRWLEAESTETGRASPGAWLLAPADQPRIAAAVIQQLLAEFAATAATIPVPDRPVPAILVPVYHGRRGHPVLFPWQLAEAVHRLEENDGVNRLLRDFPVHEIAVSQPSIVDDLDTPEDYQRLTAQPNS
ncbi:MAG: NTP transferase domain-containing protein [Planctomycetota bacterium]